MILFSLLLASCALWVIILLLPWQPWQTKERWEPLPENVDGQSDLSDVTVLIPARNEAKVIERTITSVVRQGNIQVIVIDDNSRDDTAQIAKGAGASNVTVIEAAQRPQGWSGKLWALEQGRRRVQTPVIMLLDADIMLKPGAIAGLQKWLKNGPYSFLSLMAAPSLSGFWEKLLMPAFIYFFKLLYPFHVANSSSDKVSASAGGCVMMKKEALETIGGFASIKDALIDDCMLARKIKDQGYRTWLGLTHAARSIRPYAGFGELWNMVARTAYTQLNYSSMLLLLCTAVMGLAYWIPLIALSIFTGYALPIAIFTLFIMFVTFIPTLRFYDVNIVWVIFLPLIATFFLAMTWTSAIRYWRGERLRWRGRIVKTEI
jgi:hopene-associated glycosyltransferase HpnB